MEIQVVPSVPYNQRSHLELFEVSGENVFRPTSPREERQGRERNELDPVQQEVEEAIQNSLQLLVVQCLEDPKEFLLNADMALEQV